MDKYSKFGLNDNNISIGNRMKKQVGSRRYFMSDALLNERKETKPFGNTELEEEYEK